jgi:hypothetical protein
LEPLLAHAPAAERAVQGDEDSSGIADGCAAGVEPESKEDLVGEGSSELVPDGVGSKCCGEIGKWLVFFFTPTR